jgi:hypothetical protein
MSVHLKMTKWLGNLALFSTYKFESIKLVKFWLILLSWIRIRSISNMHADPDAADRNKCESGSETPLPVYFSWIDLVKGIGI